MKKYSFRLEAVLKLRKLKEENCRMELGQMIAALNKLDHQLLHERNEIEKYYGIQEQSLKTGIRGNQIQAFPMLVAAKEKNIQLLILERKRQEKLIEKKTQELASLRGELKVIENLKEKDFVEWKKAYNKHNDQKIEEQTQNWLNHNRINEK